MASLECPFDGCQRAFHNRLDLCEHAIARHSAPGEPRITRPHPNEVHYDIRCDHCRAVTTWSEAQLRDVLVCGLTDSRPGLRTVFAHSDFETIHIACPEFPGTHRSPIWVPSDSSDTWSTTSASSNAATASPPRRNNPPTTPPRQEAGPSAPADEPQVDPSIKACVCGIIFK